MVRRTGSTRKRCAPRLSLSPSILRCSALPDSRTPPGPHAPPRAQVFSSDSALWWSPSSSHLAFLSFDETDVPEYEYPVYNVDAREPGGEAYPAKVAMRYPKVRLLVHLMPRDLALTTRDCAPLARLPQPARHAARLLPLDLPLHLVLFVLPIVPRPRRDAHPRPRAALSRHERPRDAGRVGRPGRAPRQVRGPDRAVGARGAV